VWALLSAGCVVVVFAPRFLPFYDYPEWVLQGQIVHDLWIGASHNGTPVAQWYGLLPVPVPNLAAPVGIALLAFVLPIEMAGRMFLVLGVLGFAYGYGFLVRRLQQQPTVLEFTGFLWVFGYFLERGYVSYLFGLPVAFVAIGLIHQRVGRPVERRGRLLFLALLSVLQVIAFLAHLVAWGVLALGLGCYAVALYRGGRRGEAWQLMATVAPTAALLVWYAVTNRQPGHIAFYPSLRDKLLSLAETVQLFPRLDPYPGMVASFPAQLLVAIALLGIIGWNLRVGSMRGALRTPLVGAALILAMVAVLEPVNNVNSLTKPDQRLLLPAVVLVLAAMPWQRSRPKAGIAAVAVVSATLLAHTVALVSLNAPLQQIYSATDRAIPDGAAVTTLAVPADGGCGPQPGPSIGIPALKWFDVYRMLNRHEVRANLQETSGVAVRYDPLRGPGLTAASTAAAAAPATVDATPATYVEIFACPTDLVRVRSALAPRYVELASGERFGVFRRSP
jgi:hypothetical protein